MGDPVTTGMIIGAGTGALTNRKNPLQGAMLGGAMGAAGGSFYGGAMGAGAAAPGAGANAFIPGVQGGAGALGGQTTALTAASPTFGQAMSGGFGALKSDISGLNTFMNQNPTTSQIGFGLAKQAFAPEEPMQMAPAGQVNRSAIQPMDYMSLLNPQQSTVIRPATPSLI
jgi:hypothetical protein